MGLQIVSNRVPEIGKEAAGGLATLLLDALRQGDTWTGWDNTVVDGNPGPTKIEENEKGIKYAKFSFRSGPGEKFYRNPHDHGQNKNETDFTNGTLWPLLHSMTFGKVKRPLRRAYDAINEQYASRVYKQLQPDDSVWVHDYHLLLVGKRLRNKGVTQPLGFFLHIPFPKIEVLDKLSNRDRRELFEGMLSYDLLGFQTNGDRKRFEEFAIQRLKAQPGRASTGELTTLKFEGRTIRLGVYPAGIDPKSYERITYTSSHLLQEDARMALVDPKNQPSMSEILREVGQRKMIFSVERMDPSKGILERLTDFRDFLRDNPDQYNKLAMVQIGNITRQGVKAYVKYREDVLAMRDAINADARAYNEAHGLAHRDPVILSEKTYSRVQLAHGAHNAAVNAVTPLMDGMNLVCKEMMAAQDPRTPAPLILSQGAGAYEGLKDGVIAVNMRKRGDFARALGEALIMSVDICRKKHAIAMKSVTHDTAENWVIRFRRHLTGVNDNVLPFSNKLQPGQQLGVA